MLSYLYKSEIRPQPMHSFVKKTMKNAGLLLWFLCLIKKSGGEIKHLIGDLFMLGLHESGYCARFSKESWRNGMHIRVLSTVNLWNCCKEVCSQALESPWLKTESDPDKKKMLVMSPEHEEYSLTHWKWLFIQQQRDGKCFFLADNDYLVPQENDYIKNTARPFLLSL